MVIGVDGDEMHILANGYLIALADPINAKHHDRNAFSGLRTVADVTR